MTHLLFQSKSKRHGGFTILELLAAMTILSMLVVMLVATFNQASRSWLQAENRVETYGQARAALDFITKELTQTVTTTNSSFMGDTNNLAFVATVNTGTNMDLVGVFYQLAGSAPIFALTRSSVQYSASPNWYANPSSWPASAVSTVNTLAENVVSFTLSYTDSSGNPTVPTYWNSTGSAGWPSTSAGQALMIARPPAGVQITIGIIDSRSTNRVKAGASALPVTQTFSTYVSIPNGQ